MLQTTKVNNERLRRVAHRIAVKTFRTDYSTLIPTPRSGAERPTKLVTKLPQHTMPTYEEIIKNTPPQTLGFDTVTRTQLDAMIANPRAMDRFIRDNDKFFSYMVNYVHTGKQKEMASFGEHFDDLKSVAYMAMCRVLPLYDGKVKLSTYLHTVIYRDVAREYDRIMDYNTRVSELAQFQRKSDNDTTASGSGDYYENNFQNTLGHSHIVVNMEEDILNRVFVDEVLKTFTEQEMQIIVLLRHQNLSQQKAADKLGIKRARLQYIWYRRIMPKVTRIRRMMEQHAAI